jgi:hypothetical protein
MPAHELVETDLSIHKERLIKGGRVVQSAQHDDKLPLLADATLPDGLQSQQLPGLPVWLYSPSAGIQMVLGRPYTNGMLVTLQQPSQ